MKSTIPITDLKKVGKTEDFGGYISLYEKSFEVESIAEHFYFLLSAVHIFQIKL